MKLKRRLLRSFTEAGFSGPLRAGLIEARRSPARRSAGRRGFPAPCGPASLKHEINIRSDLAHRRRFSGPLRAGLIEAARACAPDPDLSSGFPAPCGPASLKPSGSRARIHIDFRFSGPLRAGLIEALAGELGPGSTEQRRFSGPLRAGLIEAGLRARWKFVPAPGFPAPCGPASLKPRQGAQDRRPVLAVFRPLAGRPH